MLTMIDSSTTGLVSLALDAAVLRQQAIAQNIANANTPGYQRLGVRFERQLAALTDAAGQVAAPAGTLAAFQPVLEPVGPADTEHAVSIDAEMADLAQVTLHHQALLKALNQHYALLASAINEGKR